MPRDRLRLSYRPIITSAGLEIEFANISMDVVKENRKIRDNWKIVRDGSCTRNKITLPNGNEVVFSNRFNAEDARIFGFNTEYVGGEFVSPIIDIENPKWADQALYILDFLKECGEGIDLRTGIHVHINIQTPPLYALHNLVKLALGLEAPMYRLSCGELGFHRGSQSKDYMYCRPLSSPGPQVVKDSIGQWRPIFDSEKLLKTKDLDTFFVACGRLDMNAGNKWHQSRYVWLNFASIFLHKTIEWRLFNSTLEHENLLAWVELCSHLVGSSLGKGIEIPRFHLGNTQMFENTEYTFDDFLTWASITDDDLAKKLEHLWYLGEWQSKVKGHQKGHLEQILSLENLSDKDIKNFFADPVDIKNVIPLAEEDRETVFSGEETRLPSLRVEESPERIHSSYGSPPTESAWRITTSSTDRY